MNYDTFPIDNKLRLKLIFRNQAKTKTDPLGTIYAKVKAPDGTVTTYEYGVDAGFTKIEAGEYYVDHTFDQAGLWAYGGSCDGSDEVADDKYLLITPSKVSS